MKILLIIIFSIPLAVQAQTCDDLHQDLLVIENKLLTSKVNECLEGQTSNCRTENSFNLTYSDVQKNYNQALAELVIHNGIAAISSSIQGNHNLVAGLKQEQIEKASKYIEALEESVTKAEILDAATTPVSDSNGNFVSFWHKNKYDNRDISLEQFKDQLKKDCETQSEAICAEKEHFGNEEFLNTIYGFAKAELNSRTILSSDPTAYYADIKDQLKITVRDSKTNGHHILTPKQYRAFYLAEGGELATLKDDLREINNARSPEWREKFKGRILETTKNLDTISTSYGISSNIETEDENSVDYQLSKNFQKPFKDLSISFSDTFVNDTSKKNFETNLEAIRGDENVLKAGLELETKKALSEDGKLRQCSDGESFGACFDRVCSGENSCSTIRGGINIKRRKIADKQKLRENFEQASLCYNKESLSEQKICLESIAIKLNPDFLKSRKGQLRYKVVKAKSDLENYNSVEPIVSLANQKLVAISNLESANCLEDTTIIKNSCRQNAGDLTLDGSVLKLASNVGDISIRLNQNLVSKAKDSSAVLGQYNDSGEFIKQCGEEIIPGEVCSYFKNPELREEVRIANHKIQERAAEVYTERGAGTEKGSVQELESEEKGERDSFERRERYSAPRVYNGIQEFNRSQQQYKAPSTLSIVGTGVYQGLFRPNPITGRTAFGDLTSAGFGLLNTQITTGIQRDQIRFQSDLFDRQVQAFQNNLPPYRDVIPFNGGYIHNGQLYDSNFNAQAANAGLFASPFNPQAFNFQTSIPGSTGLITSPTTTTTTPVSTPTTFSF